MLFLRYTILLLVISFSLSGNSILTISPQAPSARAQAEPDTDAGDESQSVIEPEALAILEQMSDVLDSHQKFSFDAEVSYDELLNSGQMVKLGGMIKITVQRPDKVYGEFKSDRAQRKVWYSGKELTVLDQKKDFYGTLETPGTLDGTLDYLINTYDFTLPLADILHTDPYGSFSDGAVDGVVVGDSMVRGKECSHLAFVGELIDWQLWVADEGQALPCKLVITYKKKDGVPQYQAIFSKWNLNPEAPDSLFKPDLPKDAVKIEFIDLKKQRGSK